MNLYCYDQCFILIFVSSRWVWPLVFHETNHNKLMTCEYIITVMSHEHHGISDYWLMNCLFNTLSGLTAVKKNKKTWQICITGPLWGESASDWWIPLTKGQKWGEHFLVMMSSCIFSFMNSFPLSSLSLSLSIMSKFIKSHHPNQCLLITKQALKNKLLWNYNWILLIFSCCKIYSEW